VEFIKEIARIGCIVKQEIMRGALQFDKEIFLLKAQIIHRKICHQLRVVLGYSLFVIAYDK
jgi:hypothetical protein